MGSLSIVIPAFNEEGRLPGTLAVLRQFHETGEMSLPLSEVLVVDDGSLDDTRQVVEMLAREWPLLRLLKLAENQGKGAAVKKGLGEAQGEWILIADADMATPWEELNKLASYRDTAELIMGSRALHQSQIKVRQHWIRQTMGKIFNHIMRLSTGLSYKDTQCGFKLLHNSEAFRQRVLSQMQIARFAWDVELILLMEKYRLRVVEVPICWSHQESSRVHIVRDSIEMLFAIYKMRARLK